MVKLYAIEHIELSWKFQFGAIWIRIGEVINYQSWLRNILILTSLPLSFEGGVYSKEKNEKIVKKIYIIRHIKPGLYSQFGATWMRTDGDIIV